ncbi:MAG: rod shape-determining protein MreC [Bacteroidales bacterium]|nr:rod shape-determining protein MreC [Bacteroidales bacterium]
MESRSKSYNLLLTIALFVALEAAAIVMIVSNGLLQRYLVMGGIRSSQVFFWQKTENVRDYLQLSKYNQALQQENAELRSRLARMEYLEEQEGAESTREGLYNWIPASIIKNNPNKQHNYLILNRGSKDGVKPEMGVVTHNAIVGVVGAVSDHYCQVISFLNNNQKVSALITGTSDIGLLSWDGLSSSRAILSHIPLASACAAGDTVVTSGFSTIYPPEIPVGVISGEGISSGMYKSVTVDLLQDLHYLKYVYIVQRHHQDEIDMLSNQSEE